MTTWLFKNNANSVLLQATAAASISVTVPSGEGARFPAPNAGNDERAMLTLEDRRTGQLEIVRLVSRATDVMTVLRAQEGTTAQDFAAGAVVSNRLTAGVLAMMQLASSFLYAGPWDHAPTAGELNSVTGFQMPNPIPNGELFLNTTTHAMNVWSNGAWSDYSNALPLDGSSHMTGDLDMFTFKIKFEPAAGGNTILDGGGGAILNAVYDLGTF